MLSATEIGDKIAAKTGFGQDALDKQKEQTMAANAWDPYNLAQEQERILFHFVRILCYLDGILCIAGALVAFSVLKMDGNHPGLGAWLGLVTASSIAYMLLQATTPIPARDSALKFRVSVHNVSRFLTGLLWTIPAIYIPYYGDPLFQLTPIAGFAILIIVCTLTSLSLRRYAIVVTPCLISAIYAALLTNGQELWIGVGTIAALTIVGVAVAVFVEKSAHALIHARLSSKANLREAESERDRLRALSAELNQTDKLLNLVANNASDIILLHDNEGRYLYANDAMERICGYKPNDIIGKDPMNFIHNEDLMTVAEVIRTPALRGEEVKPTRYRFRHANGHYVWLETTGRRTRSKDDKFSVVSVSRDISEKIKLEDDLQRRASTDITTGVLNRATFEETLSATFTSSRSKNRGYALIYLDLDQFKIINDTSGHLAGDKLLNRTCRLIEEHLQPGDLLARMGGDEFAILMQSRSARLAQRACEKIRQTLAEARFQYSGRFYSMAASFGLVYLDHQTTNSVIALQRADVACYIAKNNGRNAIHLWHQGDAITNKHLQAMDWVTTLQSAIDKDRVELYGQAIHNINSPKPKACHFEVLSTIRDSEGQRVNPEDFVPAAEYFGLAALLDFHIVECAFEALAKHTERMRNIGWISINLSADTVCNHGTLEKIKRLIEKHQVAPEKICFEVTETATLRSLSAASELLEGLKDLGCKIALDDFGSGYSSFEHLKKLPIDIVKIDGQFISDLAHSKVNQSIVSGIFNTAEALGIKTVAEWIEDEKTLQILREIGIEYGQGFHLGQRIPLDEALTKKCC